MNKNKIDASGDTLTTPPVLYLVLVVGSLAFGLEALLLGLGGKLMVFYRRDRLKMLGLAFAVGLVIVGFAMITAAALSLEPLYLCALVLVYMFAAGKITDKFGAGLVKPSPAPLPKQPSDEELRAMLRRRGFEKLVKKKRGRRVKA